MIRSAFLRAKDAALEKSVLIFLRPVLARYGNLEALTLDTAAKKLSGIIHLHGEPSPLIISEAYYRIETQGEDAFLVFHGIKASRPWVQNLLEDHLHRLPLKLPDFLRRLIE